MRVFQKPHQMTDRGGFARAVGTQKPKDFTLLYMKRYVEDSFSLSVIAAEVFHAYCIHKNVSLCADGACYVYTINIPVCPKISSISLYLSEISISEIAMFYIISLNTHCVCVRSVLYLGKTQCEEMDYGYSKNNQEFKRTNRNEPQGVFGVYGDSGENVRRLGGGQTDSARIYSQIIGVSVEV